jgi:hypothetical protein
MRENDSVLALLMASMGGSSGGGGSGESNAVKYTAQTLTAAQQAQARANIGADGKTAEVTVADDGAVTQALDAGKLYHFTGALTALTITLNAPASGDLAEYHFDFLSGSAAPTLTMPNTVTMPDSFTVEANKRYEVDVLNGYGAVVSWANS